MFDGWKEGGRQLKRETYALLPGVVLTAALMFIALAWIAEEGYVFDLERKVQALIQFERDGLLKPPMKALSRLGSGYVIVPLTLVFSCWLWRRHRWAGLLLFGSTTGGIVVSGLVKFVISRPRPNLVQYGFPSGHVMTSVVFFGTVVYLVWVLEPSWRWRWLATVLCGLAILGIAYSRLYFNAHWFTDVFAGLIGGAGYVAFVVMCAERWRRRPDGEPASSTGP